MSTETAPPASAATDDIFVDEKNFVPPPQASSSDDTTQPNSAGGTSHVPPAPEGESRRGRPTLTEEEKAARKLERETRDSMGDLFDDDDNPTPVGATTEDSGTIPPEATKIPRPSRKSGSRAEMEALGELIAFNQYGIMGMLFDPVEACPLARDSSGKLINPDGEAMHLRMKHGWAAYLQASGMSDASPGAAMLLLQGSYLTHVISQPKSSDKMKAYVGKVVGFFRKKFGKDKKP